MARPRAGDFVYDVEEFAALCADTERLLEWGAHGVVFGCLRNDGRVDRHQAGAVVALAGYSETVFHRAFDETPDATEALATLIGCGVRRVLTSGHAATAIEGAAELAMLVQQSAGRIEILPGGTVRASNVRDLVKQTGVVQVHARASVPGVIAAIAAAL
jgi:copper homeostasis protein